MYHRILHTHLKKRMRSNFGNLLLGPRQTGKSTLLDTLADEYPAPEKLIYRFNETDTYERIVKNPSLIKNAVLASMERGETLLYIDEVQLIPEVLNDCQTLLDRYKEQITLLLTGSSARKLRAGGANLLPGRILLHTLHPLTVSELRFTEGNGSYLMSYPDLDPPSLTEEQAHCFHGSLKDILTYGSLPGICDLENDLKREVLTTYVSVYLQEEIRAEALARNLGSFARVLENAALGSGTIVNFNSVSQETGVPLSTVRNYFELLIDTLILMRIPAYTKNSRKRLIRSEKYVFFDLGVRNAAAGLYLDPPSLLRTQSGSLFEQFVILELIRRIHYTPGCPWKICHWRTGGGAEVDCVIDTGDTAVPVEIKYTDSPIKQDVRNVRHFMEEHGSPQGFLVCRCREVQKLAEHVYAVPWWSI
jgi:uncharacterized protein